MSSLHRPSTAGASILVLTVLAAVVVLGVDATLEPAGMEPVRIIETDVLAGRSVCTVSAEEGDEVVVASIADAPTADATEPAADASADTTEPGGTQLLVEQDGDVARLAVHAATGGAQSSLVADATGDALVSARWEDAPVLLSRRWRTNENSRVPGTVEGPCPSESATRWLVPGVATAGGAAASLHLGNPTDGPAAVAVRFTTPEGLVEPTRLANLVVPAHGRTTIDLNEFAPEQPDLGVEVVARTGQIVVEAVQTLEAAVGGVDGRSLVVAHHEPDVLWTVPWTSAGAGESAWVWVTNPSEEATEVRIVVQTPAGPVVPPAGGATLPPGTTQRIDLRGALGEGGSGAVTVRSTSDVGVVVSGAVVRAVEGDAVRGGIAVIEAAPASGGRQAVLSAVGDAASTRLLAIANPTDDEVVADVRVVGGSPDAVATVAQGVVVAPGAWTTVDLTGFVPADGASAVVVDVTTGAAVVAVVTSSTEGALDLTAVAGRPFARTVDSREVALVEDRSLLHPLQPMREPKDEAPAVTVDDLLGG